MGYFKKGFIYTREETDRPLLWETSSGAAAKYGAGTCSGASAAPCPEAVWLQTLTVCSRLFSPFSFLKPTLSLLRLWPPCLGGADGYSLQEVAQDSAETGMLCFWV